MRAIRHALAAALAMLTAGAVLVAQTPVAHACGCLSPNLFLFLADAEVCGIKHEEDAKPARAVRTHSATDEDS